MKKTYVKPVMESEAFVANEYVAACYAFEFECRNSLCAWRDRSAEADTAAEAIEYLNKLNSRDSEVIRGSENSYYHESSFGRNHTVYVNKIVLNPQYPNASV